MDSQFIIYYDESVIMLFRQMNSHVSATNSNVVLFTDYNAQNSKLNCKISIIYLLFSKQTVRVSHPACVSFFCVRNHVENCHYATVCRNSSFAIFLLADFSALFPFYLHLVHFRASLLLSPVYLNSSPGMDYLAE